MLKISKKMLSLVMAILTICSVFSLSSINIEAASYKGCGYVINVYDGGQNYSGRYACRSESSFGKVGLFGKKVTIEFVNFCSGLTPNQANFYKKYAKFRVYVCSNDTTKKYYEKKIGDSFTIPSGKNMRVVIYSEIDSSGWKEFNKQMKSGLPWTFGQYRLKY